MTAPTPIYTLGRGTAWFSPYQQGTFGLAGPGGPGLLVNPGERPFGNCPSFKLNTKTTMLDHYSSQSGVKELDDSTVLEIERTASLTCDDVQVENLALWYLGTNDVKSQSAQTALSDGLITQVVQGLTYQLGASSATPAGVRKVTNVIVRNQQSASGATIYVAGTDYTVDTDLGRVYVIPGGAITGAMYVVYDTTAVTYSRVISSNQAIEGTFRYIAANPKGPNRDIFVPWVVLTPDGDYELITDTWQQMTFSMEIKVKPGYAAAYNTGRAS